MRGYLHSANHLLAVVLPGQSGQGRLDDTTSESQHQVQSRLLLDVVVAQGTTILQLLTSEDQSLLIRWDALLILNLALDGLNGITGLDIQRNCLTREGLDEDLHLIYESAQKVGAQIL
jgi:hypothetical protein